ncbi:MAG: universal stress protein [Caldimonas sp.]
MYQRILVPIDGSPTAAAGLDEAIRLAGLTGAVLRVIHILDASAYVTGFETGAVYCNEVVPAMKRTGQRILDDAMRRVEQGHRLADCALVETVGGFVPDLVVTEARAWGADLIVIGTHGRRGVDRFMVGSHAEQIARMAPVPVLLVRATSEASHRGEVCAVADAAGVAVVSA